MESPETFRARAAELRRKAADTRDGTVRYQLLLMAQDWDRMAAPSSARSGVRETACGPAAKPRA